MLQKVSERSVSVRVKGMVLTATYLPDSSSASMVEVEGVLEELGAHVRWARSDELVVVGGDFNAHVGGDEDRRGVCGRFGLRASNPRGVQLLEWCEENGLSHVSSFYNHRRRGTWFSNFTKQWYELDGFLMRNRERQNHVRKVCTVGEASLSDHKPKKLRLRLKKRRWRTPIQRKKVPLIKWERLADEQVAAQYSRRMGEEMRNLGEVEVVCTGWAKFAEKVVGVASEVCGLRSKSVENPWMVGREEEISRMRRAISVAMERKNQAAADNRNGTGSEEDLEEKWQVLREARREWKRETRAWESQWWQGVVADCVKAEEVGDAGSLYRNLKKIGLRDVKTGKQETKLTTEQFRDHFKKVSEDRFEMIPRK